MNRSEFELLCDEQVRLAIEQRLGGDPVRIALDKRLPHAALIASQVKYLERARTKLPSYYAARCILPARAFEQSSSEACAAHKAFSGELCIDLTCGLGVDSLYLSRQFKRVVALERDPMLAAVTRENFRRLGAPNIEVVETSAEQFLSAWHDKVDLIYADPDRRSEENRKLVRLQDCSPDLIPLLPRIRELASRFVVKLSPLFDTDEALRIFGPDCLVEAVSLAGECKEMLVTQGDNESAPRLRATALGIGSLTFPAHAEEPVAEKFPSERYDWLLIPDVALRKIRCVRRHLTDLGVCFTTENGYGFASKPPKDFMGRMLAIERMEPYDPKRLRRVLKAADIGRIDILHRDFPLSSAQLAAQLHVKEGGRRQIAFTVIDGESWQIVLKEPSAQETVKDAER